MLAGVALWVNWAAALVVFIVPMLMMRWLMMAGNWGQHAFVDVDDPGNVYRNSTNLTNTSYNHKAYNDGYHIVHHLKPGLGIGSIKHPESRPQRRARRPSPKSRPPKTTVFGYLVRPGHLGLG